jgi:hydrogenase expression/formation protein HypC
MCVGIPGRILETTEGDFRFARVAFGDVIKDVSLALVPEARLGDYVLVSLGSAVTVLEEGEAQEILDLLEAFAGSLEEEDVRALEPCPPAAGCD